MNYNEKASNYFSNIRNDLTSLIKADENGLKILEVGAAYGETLYYLKNNGVASYAVGIDIFEDKSNKQNYKEIDRFIFGNIEELELSEFHNHFDIILLPDVLEHLIEPKAVLDKLKKCLNQNGKIIVSMPNIRHYSAVYKIFVKGDFSYEESGIFDYTHMRFYCRKNIKALLESSGYKVLKQQSSINSYKGKSMSKILNKITFRIFEEFFSYQYFFVAKN
jgi:2-polyprenyl-3-methyl-5-hydroxy-6-metoxy-1,4-benzoquinol methylase